MWGKIKNTLVRPTRIILGIFLLVLFQDLLATLLAHRQFATSIVCADPSFRVAAGRYLDVHCWEHAELGNWRRGSAWINALTELPWQRVVAIAAGVYCF